LPSQPNRKNESGSGRSRRGGRPPDWSRLAPDFARWGEEDLFAYLCMHGVLHWWQQLKWVADINALLAAASEDNMLHLVRAAEVRGVGRATAQALRLCGRLLGTPLPARLFTKNATALAGRNRIELDDHRPRGA
jgi:hypothetical protein